MATLTAIAVWVLRLTGITQVGLGLLFWTNRALTLLPLHMAIGMVFVLALWTLSGLAARSGLRWWMVLAAVAWGAVVPAFGMLQTRLLHGPLHWVVEVTHLLIGIVAMVIGARLARFIRAIPRTSGASVGIRSHWRVAGPSTGQ
jgi:hypothetical protein